MGRNKGSKNISKKVFEIIYEEIKKCPKDTNRDVLATQIENHPYFTTGYGVPPSHETLLRKISEISEEIKKDPGTQPWNLGALSQLANFPGDSLPLIMKITEMRRETNFDLTVRQAKWIASIYPLVKNTRVLPLHQILDILSSRYASQEEMCIFMGIQVGTANLDTTILKDYEEYTAYPHLYKRNNLGLLKHCLMLRSQEIDRSLTDSENEFLSKVDELNKGVSRRNLRIGLSREIISKRQAKGADSSEFLEDQLETLTDDQVKLEELAIKIKELFLKIGGNPGIKIDVNIPQGPEETN